MPLIVIKRNPLKIKYPTLYALGNSLPAVAADALTCAEGGQLEPKDIIIEFETCSSHDMNAKDINVRVIAHDYPARRGDLDNIRRLISAAVVGCLPDSKTSWYVWVMLLPTSYGSDTEKN